MSFKLVLINCGFHDEIRGNQLDMISVIIVDDWSLTSERCQFIVSVIA